MAFDLDKQDPAKFAEEGFTFNLVTPDGETHLDVTLTVRGSLSKQVRNFNRTLQTQYQMRDIAAKKRGKEKADDLSPEEYDELGIRSACIRLIGWKGFVRDGVAIEYSEAEALRVMTEKPWLREIIVKESDDALNFRSK